MPCLPPSLAQMGPDPWSPGPPAGALPPFCRPPWVPPGDQGDSLTCIPAFDVWTPAEILWFVLESWTLGRPPWSWGRSLVSSFSRMAALSISVLAEPLSTVFLLIEAAAPEDFWEERKMLTLAPFRSLGIDCAPVPDGCQLQLLTGCGHEAVGEAGGLGRFTAWVAVGRQ